VNHDDEFGTLEKDILASDLLLISGDDIQSQLSRDPDYWHQFSPLPLNENLVSDDPVFENDVQNTVTHIDSMSFSESEDINHVSDSSPAESVVIPLHMPACNPSSSSGELAIAVKDAPAGGSHVSQSSNCDVIRHSPGILDDCQTAEESHNKESTHDDTHTDSVGDSNDDVTCSVTVAAVTSNANNRNYWDKKYYCPFCSLSFSKLARHMEGVHREEAEVARFLALPKKSESRCTLLRKLSLEGNYKHNCKVLQDNSGTLIPMRRPSKHFSPDKFLPCQFCLGFFMKREIWRHRKHCTMNTISTSNAADLGPSRRCQGKGSLLLPMYCRLDIFNYFYSVIVF